MADMRGQGVEALLQELEERIRRAPRVPITGRLMFDEEELLDLVQEIRRRLPAEMQAARALERERERILTEAEREAQSLLREARARIERLAKEAPEVVEAERRAKEVLAEAERRARELYSRGLSYLDEVLLRVETQLRRVADTLEQNRQELAAQMPKDDGEREEATRGRRQGRSF